MRFRPGLVPPSFALSSGRQPFSLHKPLGAAQSRLTIHMPDIPQRLIGKGPNPGKLRSQAFEIFRHGCLFKTQRVEAATFLFRLDYALADKVFDTL